MDHESFSRIPPSPEESKVAETAVRTPEEERAFFERLQSIIRTISERPDLVVTTKMSPDIQAQMQAEGKDPNDAWYLYTEYDRVSRKPIRQHVRVPEQIVDSPDFARGAAAHEAGHVLITRYGEFVPRAVMQELGFHSLMAAAEERPTDHVVRERYEGAGAWVDTTRKELIAKAGVPDPTSKLFPQAPRFAQLCDLIVFDRYHEEEAKAAYYSEEALAAYAKIDPVVRKIESTLPAPGSSEKEVRNKAIERYQIVYRELWPILKPMMEQDRQEQAERNLLEEEHADHIPQTAAEAIERILDEALTADGEQMQELSRELVEILKEIFAMLPREVQEELLRQATEEMERIEDEIVNGFDARLTENPPLTHSQVKRVDEIERTEAKRREDIRKAEEERERLAQPLEAIEIGGSLGEYEQAYSAVRELDEELYARLSEILYPNIRKDVKLRSSGGKLNLPAVFRWKAQRAAGNTGNDKIFESVITPEAKDYAFEILVDLSGSMSQSGYDDDDDYYDDGEYDNEKPPEKKHLRKVDEALRAVALLSEVLERLGVPFEVTGYQNIAFTLKSFETELDDNSRTSLGSIPLEVESENPGGNNRSGSNNDGPCLMTAAASLAAQQNKKKFLLVLSDGLPTGGGTINGERLDPYQALTQAVAHISSQEDIHLVGIGVGEGTDHVANYYPTALPNIRAEVLAEQLGALLEDIILRPEAY
ncbi:MAG TPA: hypothetical protein VLA04_05395 [Verrucomicrobiae bacterium]|nr:hypothetical protein [Verrucomicrobiae bacterium]